MDGLSAAASAIAVVDLSVKVISLCSQYAKGVANAAAEISRLETLVKGLKTTLDHAEALIKSPQGTSLSTSHDLQDQLAGCQSTLQQLHDKLNMGVARQTKRRLWTRALKWPFSHGEIEALMSTIERYHRRIMDGLQVDQTTLLLHIRNGVDRIPAATNGDISIAQGSHFVVPFPRDPDFVPRPAIQTQIREQLEGTASRLALIGMGGFGKSQLAIELAHDVHCSTPEKSAFWLHGSSRTTLEESYRSLADKLALPHRHDPKINIFALVRDWLQREDVAPWLIILDNADDSEVFFNLSEATPVASYLPKTSNGKILVTSRNLNVAEKLIGSYKAIIKVPPMNSHEALLLVQEKLGSSYDETSAIDLISCLDCIPLAVNQAAAYINRRCISINEYIQRFQKNNGSLLKHDGGDIRRYESVSNSVAITWQVTFDQIRQESPAAANLLSLLSCFQPQNIPEGMLSGYNEAPENTDPGKSDGEILEDDMDVLFAYSLVSRPTEPHVYEMHSLVQVCTRAWLTRLDSTPFWEKLFLRLASEHFPTGHFESWPECQLLLPHLERVLAKQPDVEADLLNWGVLLKHVSWYRVQRGDYNKAEFLARKSVEVGKKLLGSDHPDTLTSMAILASICWNQGRWDEAESLGLQVMETRKTKLGVEHPDTLASMANLSSIFWKQGRWEEAERLSIQVIETNKITLGLEHPDTVNGMNSLASIYGDQGRWDEAERLGLQVMETRKTKLGVEHPDTLTSMANLAATYVHQGRLEEAERLSIQVIEARKIKLGRDHPNTLTSIHTLAVIYGDQGRWEEAERLEVLVMETRKSMLGADHPGTLTSTASLASIIWNQGRLEEAERLEVQVMKARKSTVGADHPDTLTSMHNLAYTLQSLGRLDEALDLMEQCASRRRRVLGQKHPDFRSSKKTIELWQRGDK